MAYAHARGVIHRDLKPSNIMVGAFGEVQVMDWGLAKVLARDRPSAEESARLDRDSSIVRTVPIGSDTSGSQTGSVFGTPAYMAPEQVRGELALVDERADVFGLGAILLRDSYRATPVPGRKRWRWCGQHQGGSGRPGRCPGSFGRVWCRAGAGRPARDCLAPLYAQRPRNADEVAVALTTYRRGVHERLRRAELSSVALQAKAHGEQKRRRLAVALAAAVVGLLATAGGVGAWLIHLRQERAAQVDLLFCADAGCSRPRQS